MGVRNICTPAFSAPIIFSAIPPIGPTCPSTVIVPVPAIFLDLIVLPLFLLVYACLGPMVLQLGFHKQDMVTVISTPLVALH